MRMPISRLIAVLAAALVAVIAGWGTEPSATLAAQISSRGPGATVSGHVAADRGAVRGFRVKFRHTLHRMTYTVFTRAGRYQISDLPPGPYEVRVMELGFESSVARVDLAAGRSHTIDLALKAMDRPPEAEPVDIDMLYPPGPGRELFVENCLGCHGKPDPRLRVPRAKEGRGGWREKVDWMTLGHPEHGGSVAVPDLSAEQKEAIVDYLTRNFGPGRPARELKKDALEIDENVVGDVLYVEYELPSVQGPPFKQGLPRRRSLHDVNVMSDQTIWAGGLGSGSLLQMNPREFDFARRFKEYLVDAPYNVGPRAVVEDGRGRYYWSENNRDSHLGELDIKTGAMKRYPMLSPGYMHTVIADSKGNVWYTQFWGGKKNHLGKLDAQTRKITEYEVPVAGASLYDVVVDQNDIVWTSGVGKNGYVFKFDPRTEKFTTYPTPTKASGPRRLEIDSSGKVWVAESGADRLGMVDPSTGDFMEYPLPLRYTRPYEVWEAQGAIWTSDEVYSALVRFDRQSKKFTYVPLPTPGTGMPKAKVDKEGTSWFATRGSNQQIVAFKPRGNAVPRAMNR